MQRAGFRTKRPARAERGRDRRATELEPYVESVYPGGDRVLYRREPIVLAFDERFSTLLPVDRDAAAPERSRRATQLLEWVLAVQQVDGRRLSVPTADWVVAHRGTAPPPRPRPRVIDDVLVRRRCRRAPTLDPLVERLEALERALAVVRAHGQSACTPRSCSPRARRPGGRRRGETRCGRRRTTLRAAVRRKARTVRATAAVRRRRRDRADRGRRGAADRDRAGGSPTARWPCRACPQRGCGTTPCSARADWDHIEMPGRGRSGRRGGRRRRRGGGAAAGGAGAGRAGGCGQRPAAAARAPGGATNRRSPSIPLPAGPAPRTRWR